VVGGDRTAQFLTMSGPATVRLVAAARDGKNNALRKTGVRCGRDGTIVE
jgi:hypothetical protein